MPEDSFDDDIAISGFTTEVPKVVSYSRSETLQSGYCNKCHKRYTSAPVIDGIVHCPHCFVN